MKLNKEEMGLHGVSNEQYSHSPKTGGRVRKSGTSKRIQKTRFLHHAHSFKYLHIPQT